MNVIPAKAGTHAGHWLTSWIPASAGMTCRYAEVT
jgi:hypothetical protein